MSQILYRIFVGFLVVFFFVFSAFVLFDTPREINADAPHNIAGWAWSDNIGWVSFSCENEDECADIDYGVDVASDGKLSGYAWSYNIGWLSFNQSDLASCPNPPCTARLSDGTGILKGWAKALSADGDGWDGFISLSGNADDGSSYGPELNNGDPNNRVFEGYAWGDDVVGWLKFDAWTGYRARLSLPLCNENGICEAGLGEDMASCSEDCRTDDFSLSSSGDLSVDVVSGVGAETNEITLTVVSVQDFDDDVTLSVDSSDISGAEFIFTDQTLSEDEYDTGSAFSINVPGDTDDGLYSVTILGEGGGLSRTVNIVVNVGNIDPSFEEF